GVTALLQTPVGYLVDSYGARRFLISGALLMSLSIAAMGFATSFWQILLLALLSGIGNSVFHPADYAIISGSVDKDRMGRAFALHTFSGNLGFASAPPIMALLIVAIGWRTSVMLVGAVGVLVAAAIVLQSGILNDGSVVELKQAAPSARSLLLSRTILLFFGFYLLGSMAATGVQAWLITVLHTVKGLDLAAASAALTGYMVGTTLGVLAGGWFADAYKSRLMGCTLATLVVAAVLLAGVDALSLPGLAAIGVMFLAGLLVGTSRTPRDMMLKEAAPQGQIGKVFGFVSAGLPLGSALTPVPFGFLIDRGHPELILVLVAALLVLSLFFVTAARSSARAAVVIPAVAE
ncbi:MAG TPA: MFS transporter, partial [Acetobacteraceae bacterium]|nr:MFS transporter [Acetobacteraceae bacterium]